MKNSLKLRTLVTLSFMIFLLPFLRTCSDRSIEYSTPELVPVELAFDSANVLKNDIKIQVEILNLNKDRKKNILEKKKENTFNLYELLYNTFGNITLKQIEISILKDKTFYPLFGFLIILIISILTFIFAFIAKYNLTFKYAILNLILILLSTIGFILSGIVEDINQFKIGYYIFILNSILIIIMAKKIMNDKKNVR